MKKIFFLFLISFPAISSAQKQNNIDPQNICYSSPGNYEVTLIATNSAGSDTLTFNNYISIYPFTPPQAIIQSTDKLISNQGFSVYQWCHNGNIINGATDYFLIIGDSGDYNVTSADINGCEVEAAIYDVHIDIGEFILNTDFHSEVNLNLINTQALPSGMYRLRIFSDDKIINTKFIKQYIFL